MRFGAGEGRIRADGSRPEQISLSYNGGKDCKSHNEGLGLYKSPFKGLSSISDRY